MNASQICKPFLPAIAILMVSCGLIDQSATQKPSNSGLIATPVTYYSTSRARYLGAKYKDNLDRLVERIVRNSKTANLQFANNIASVGGIGFFTHSATKTADERYLEVVLAVPETFETKGAHSDKVNRLFNSYGMDLLTILSGDNDIYQDKELAGYGLNLSWRNVIADPAGNRVTLERAIVYLSKEKTRSFVRREINQNDLLATATIFAVEEDGPLNLISYRAPEIPQEYRSAIREDDITPASAATKPAQPPTPVKTESPDQGKKEAIQLKEPVAKVAPPKPPVIVAQKPKLLPPKAPVIPEPPSKPAPPTPAIAAAVEAPVGEAVPVEIAKSEVPAPVTISVPETKEVTPVVKPVVKTTEPAHAVTEAAKPVDAPRLPLPAPVETAPPEVVASAAKVEPEALSAIQAKPIESVVPAPLVNAPEPPAAGLKPFLPLPVAPNVAAAETPKVREPAPLPLTAVPESKPVEIVSAPPIAVTPAQPKQAVQTPVAAPVQAVARNTVPVVETPARPAAAAPTPVVENAPAKPAAEKLALLANKPIEAAPVKPQIARSAPKPLEGFIIQLAFNDRERAQRWAEAMEKKGFAVSVTEAGAEGALRVRLGNFVLRDDAERQLKAIKQEGMNGIILNLPQAFRPEARSSIP